MRCAPRHREGQQDAPGGLWPRLRSRPTRLAHPPPHRSGALRLQRGRGGDDVELHRASVATHLQERGHQTDLVATLPTPSQGTPVRRRSRRPDLRGAGPRAQRSGGHASALLPKRLGTR